MAESFLVEFRLRGYAQEYAEWASARVLEKAKSLGIRKVSGGRFVSHITLFGSAKTNTLEQVASRIERIRKYYLRSQPNTLVPFKIKGIGNFDRPDRAVIYLDVDPSPELEQFRWELAQSLTKISSEYAPWDNTQKYEFHSTVGIFQPTSNDKFSQLCNYAETQCNLAVFKRQRTSSEPRDYDSGINQHLLRITVLRGSRIHFEYDLVLKRLLSREEAVEGYLWKQTIEKLKELRV